MAFGLALVGGIAGMALPSYGRSGAGRETESAYSRILAEADVMAGESGELYLPAVTAKYTEAADLIPSREDAYLRILDYCAQRKKTGIGVGIVGSRIDSGSGGIDHCPSVLFRAAELCFAGSPSDRGFSGNCRKAARYFAMVDRRVLPETVYFASISEAMAQAQGKADWSHIGEMLRHFEEFNEKLPSIRNRIRNRVMAARVYTANCSALAEAQVDSCTCAVRLLEAALEEVNGLIEDEKNGGISGALGFDKERMKRRILWDLDEARANWSCCGNS